MILLCSYFRLLKSKTDRICQKCKMTDYTYYLPLTMSPACELVLFSGVFATEYYGILIPSCRNCHLNIEQINLQFINTNKENQLLNSKNMYEILELTARLYPCEGSRPKHAVITTIVSFLIANLSSPTPTFTSPSTTLSGQLLCSERLD